MTNAFEMFNAQYASAPPQKLQGYGSVPFEEMSADELRRASLLLREALFVRTDDTAIDGLMRLDREAALPILREFLNQVPYPNGASLDAAATLYDATAEDGLVDVVLKHFDVPSRFYRRSAINASSRFPTSDKLMLRLKARLYTDDDETNVHVAAKELLRRHLVPAHEQAAWLRVLAQSASKLPVVTRLEHMYPLS